MSYILDALQRAEADRERGGVPGLHAHSSPPGISATGLSARRRATLALIGVLVLCAVAAGLWAWRSPVTLPVAQPNSLVQAAPTAASLQPVALATAPVTAVPVARVVAPRAPATDIAPTAKAAIPPSSTINTPLLSELPQDIRQQIPALTITGVVYSENPAQRLLLLNGQVLSQGSLAGADVTLEHIGANTSEFSFRGTRFRMAH